jgi:restriction endonuclease S subunit
MSIHTNLNKKYIVYILKILQDVIFSNADGPGQKNMKIEKMLDINIPIPSLENQQKIIDKLDTYFDEDSIHKFDLNTIMKYENGNRMLNYIFNEEWTKFLDCVEKAQKIDDLKSIKTNQLLTELSNRTIVKFNPETKSKTKTNIEEYVIETFLKKEFDFISKDMEFESKMIRDICDIKGGIKFKLNGSSTSGNIPYFRVQNFNDDKNILYINSQDEKLVENFKIKCGDVLLSIVGTLGNIMIVPNNYENYVISGNIIRLFNFKNINSKYFKYVFEINKDIYLNKSGENCQPNWSITKVKLFSVQIPSLTNQQIIVNYLDEKMEYHKTYWTTMSQMFSNDVFSTYDDSNIVEESNDLEEEDETTIV